MAIGVFILIVSAIFGLIIDSYRSTNAGDEYSRALFLVQEGLDAARAIRDVSWLNLIDGNHGVDKGAGSWEFSGSQDVTDGFYTRVVTVEQVNRSSVGGDIVTSGGTFFGRVKKVTSRVTWTSNDISRSASEIVYLTDWNVFDWHQSVFSDFSGGTLSNASTTGSIGSDADIILANSQTWNNVGGSIFFHASSTDFSPGTFSSTTVVGTGLPAGIKLSQTTQWSNASSTQRAPISNQLNDVSMVSINDGWMVGNSGTILRWEGLSWATSTSPTTVNINAISDLSSENIWAVGDDAPGATPSLIMNWDGVSWTTVNTAVVNNLNGIDMVSSTDGWIVGDAGKILHWDGVSWTEFTDTGNQKWNDVALVSSTDGWAVGSGGAIYRWNGTTWSSFTSPSGQALTAIDMVSATDGWIVGDAGHLIRWNGSTWSVFVDTGNEKWNDIKMVSSTDGWIMADAGNIWHWDGTSWGTVISPTGNNLQALDMVSRTEGWAAGTSGTILHYSADTYAGSGTFLSPVLDSGVVGSTWDNIFWSETLPVVSTDLTIAVRTGPTATPDVSWSAFSAEFSDPLGQSIGRPDNRYAQYRVTLTASTDQTQTPELHDISIIYNAPTGQNMNGISMVSLTDGWAVGNNGAIARWNGASWSSFSSPTSNNLNAVKMLSSTDGWAVGDSGIIIQWNGTSWSIVTSLVTENILGLDFISATDGWAAAVSGKILRWNGIIWAEFVDTGATQWNDISMVSTSDGWIVGSGGAIFQWNGTTWSSVTSPVASSIESIDMVSSTDGWAGAAAGQLLRWNGSSWSTFVDTGSESWNGLNMLSTIDGWVVGSGGAIRQWGGATWNSFTSPTSNVLNSVSAVNSLNGWAAGNSGAIIKYTDQLLSSGTFTSTVLDTGTTTLFFQNIYWTATLPTSTSVSVATRSGSVATPDITWSAFTSEATVATGSPILSPNNRYLQYRLTLQTTDVATTSRLQDITITYK